MKNYVKGEDHPKAKLTWDDVKEIRRRYPTTSISQLARELLVDRKTIRLVVQNKTWVQCPQPPYKVD